MTFRGFHIQAIKVSRLLGLTAIGTLLACQDQPTGVPESATGSLTVHVATIGTRIDRGEFTLMIGSERDTVIAINDTKRFGQIPVGETQIELAGLGGWCGVVDENPQPVTITADRVSTVSFNVLCDAGIQVSVSTTGSHRDLDGYRVAALLTTPFYEERFLAVGSQDQAFLEVPAGDHFIGIVDYNPNCSASGPNPTAVTVTGGSIVDVSLTVHCAAPPPLSGVIFYDSDRDGRGPQLYRTDLATGATVQITKDSTATTASRPAVTLDGSVLAFERRVWDSIDLYTARPDGTGLSRVTTSEAWDWTPAWSPDGSRLAFASPRGPNANVDIFSIAADGTDLRRLTSHPSYDQDPTWSPDGSMIAFVSRRPDNDAPDQIFIMNADGSNLRSIATPEVAPTKIDWSPDGSRLAFTTWTEANTRDVFVVNLDGTGLRNVSNRVEDSFAPAWSPDGTMLAYVALFVRDTGAWDWEVMTMRESGQGISNVTNHPGSDGSPAWGP